jgi:hypothetical protein
MKGHSNIYTAIGVHYMFGAQTVKPQLAPHREHTVSVVFMLKVQLSPQPQRVLHRETV